MPPLAVVVFPDATRDDPSPVPIVVPPDALDMVGIRATVGDRDHDILSREGRRGIAENAEAAPNLARDVAEWADSMEHFAHMGGEHVAPRMCARLKVEGLSEGLSKGLSEIIDGGPGREQLRMPEGVTVDGLARWIEARDMIEVHDDGKWTQSDCERALLDFAGGVVGERGVGAPIGEAMSAREMFARLARKHEAPSAASLPPDWLARLTTVPTSTVSCARLGGGVDQRLHLPRVAARAEQMGWTRIDEEWWKRATEEIAESLREELPGYRPAMTLLTRTFREDAGLPSAAADMLLIAGNGEIHACTWPTLERKGCLVMKGCGELPLYYPMVAAHEIPSMEAVMDLETRVRERPKQARHESEPQPAPLPAM